MCVTCGLKSLNGASHITHTQSTIRHEDPGLETSRPKFRFESVDVVTVLMCASVWVYYVWWLSL